MHSPAPKKCAAVYFNADLEECIARVRGREGHPTIRAHTRGSERIVRGFHTQLQPPTVTEGFGRIYTIRSHDDATALLQAWGIDAEAQAWV
mmetsp:Transcript_37950/g.119045  ORF Transcript_37950/g.119045 Transcript_37950/m.119045 type:complete len:91 (-) Transcript_37950:93-365(-)